MDHDLLIKDIRTHIKENLGRPLTVESIAREFSRSASWLSKSFKKHTNQSVLSYLLSVRMEKARDLLRNTRLSITEIAFDTGFNSYTHFTNTFKEREGQTPSDFRKDSKQDAGVDEETNDDAGAPLLFSDAMAGPALARWWQPKEGAWTQCKGYVEGKGTASLLFSRRLPENVRISFDAYTLRRDGQAPSDLQLYLGDESRRFYCGIVVGSKANIMGEIRCMGRLGVHENSGMILKEGQWQRMVLEVWDDTITFTLDNEKQITFRDPFPPSHAARACLELDLWAGAVRLRNFVLEDLGFLQLTRTIRRADALFNAGLWDRALDFYQRLLSSASSPTDRMELYYKIGLCFLEQGLHAKAKIWLSKVTALPESEFWLQHAKLALLQITWKMKDEPRFAEDAKNLFMDTATRSGVRSIVEQACAELDTAGFFARTLDLAQLLSSLEPSSTYWYAVAQTRLAEAHLRLNHLSSAKEVWLRATELEQEKNTSQPYLLLNLADVTSFQGKTAESRKVLSAVRARSGHSSVLARCDVYEAALLRAEMKYAQSIKVLKDIASRFPGEPLFAAYAELIASLIQCGLNDSTSAQASMERAKQIDPDCLVRYGASSRFLYPPLLLSGNFLGAAEILKAGSKDAGIPIRECAEQMVKAGILFELAGQASDAHDVWSEVTRRFPENQCSYYAILARQLLDGAKDSAEDMPYPFQVQSEILFLLGLLWEKRGDKESGRKRFRFCVEKDKTLQWPAMLAQRRLTKDSSAPLTSQTSGR